MTIHDSHYADVDHVKVTTQSLLWQQDSTTIDFTIEDWWDRITDRSWSDAAAHGNLAAVAYAKRVCQGEVPTDNEVVYGHCAKGFGHLVHTSEIHPLPDTEK